MKPIEIADQQSLSFARITRITVDGIRYRLFRASVTVAVIAVATAFLMNILSESLFKRSVARDTRERIARMRLVHAWMARLTASGASESMLAEFARTRPGDPVHAEASRLGRLSAEEMAQLVGGAREAMAYLIFFEGLDYARRRDLVHTAEGTSVFERLATPVGWSEFTAALKDMKSVRFVTELSELQEFLARWPVLKDLVRRVRKGRDGAIRLVDSALRGRTIQEALSDAGGDFGRSVREAGFQFDAEVIAPIVADQARILLDSGRIEKSLKQLQTRQAIAQRYNILPVDVTVKLMWEGLRSPSTAAWYLEKMNGSGIDTKGLSTSRLVDLAKNRREEAVLVRAERLTADFSALRQSGFAGLGQRMSWLLFVSMLVCAIGIANAMLMTVTERFREIATMKCLGALDGVIMAMFVLESSFLGLAGGILGAALGSLIGLGRMLAAFGGAFIGSVPVGEIMVGMIVTVVFGVVLAAVAAVYPSFRAARLAPMEAMRIE